MPPQLNVQFDFTKKHDKAHTYTTWKKKWSGAKKKKGLKKTTCQRFDSVTERLCKENKQEKTPTAPRNSAPRIARQKTTKQLEQ